MSRAEVISWLQGGDVALRFQTARDLLGRSAHDLQDRIALEGDGAALLCARQPDGHWGGGFYATKWTSSHYTLLELKNLGLSPLNPAARETSQMILDHTKIADGGLNPAKSAKQSDVCVNGMALNYLSYFGADQAALESLVDMLLDMRLPDGGFNCRYKRTPTQHSSVHTTLSVIEGITQYGRDGYTYRLSELLQARAESLEFFLRHRLFRSERTGEVIHPEFLRPRYPSRWHFDVLRCLDAFASASVRYDDRMADALGILRKQQRVDGRWAAAAPYPGKTHPLPSRGGDRHRWVTLQAMRVLDAYPEQG